MSANFFNWLFSFGHFHTLFCIRSCDDNEKFFFSVSLGFILRHVSKRCPIHVRILISYMTNNTALVNLYEYKCNNNLHFTRASSQNNIKYYNCSRAIVILYSHNIKDVHDIRQKKTPSLQWKIVERPNIIYSSIHKQMPELRCIIFGWRR